MRSPARAICSSTPGSHQTWKVSTTTPTASTGSGSAMSRAWRQRGDDAAVGGEDRVHRLDGEPDADVERVRDQRLDRGGGSVTGGAQVAVAGRQTAGHEHQARGAERGGLVERAAVVVVPLGLRRGRRRR